MWLLMLGIFPPKVLFFFFHHVGKLLQGHIWHLHAYFPPQHPSLYRGAMATVISPAARGQINPLLLHSRHSLNWYVASVQILMCTLHSNQWAEDLDFSVQQRHQKQARLVRLRDYHCLHFLAQDESIGKRINLSAIWCLHPPTHAHTHTHTHTHTHAHTHTHCDSEIYFIIMGNNSKQLSFPRAWFWKVNSIWEGDKVGCCDHHTLIEYSQRYNGSCDSHHCRCMKMIMSQGRGRHVRFPWLEAPMEGLIQHAKQFLCNFAYTN